jgi:glycosyltransferase involved in cell wall biosynthesis
MLLETPFPADERVEKEIRTLMDHGYDVHLACSTRTGEPAYQKYKGMKIHRLGMNAVWFKLSALVLILPFYIRRWTRFVRRLNRLYQFDIVHVHDLPLSRAGLNLKRKNGLQLVCDQHEYYSNWIVDTAHYNTFAGKLVRLLSNWRKYEEKMLSAADLVITVAEPLRNQYINEYHLRTEKIITLPNTPLKAVFSEKNTDISRYGHYRDHFSVLYFGGIDVLRGIDNIIKAIPMIREEVPGFIFVLAGRTSGGYDPIQTAIDHGVESHIDFIGWLELEQLPSLISACSIGIFTPPSNRTEINNTIATKNYQFLVMNKPVIVGRATYMKAFTEKNGIGMSVNESKPEEIAKAVVELSKNEKTRIKMVRQCEKIRSRFYWENTSVSLVDGYRILNEAFVHH